MKSNICSAYLIISMRNHGNSQCHLILKLADCTACRILIQWQHLLLQLMDAFLQQEQFTRVQVDLDIILQYISKAKYGKVKCGLI